MKKTILLLILTITLFGAPTVGDKAVSFKLPNLYKLNSVTTSQELQGKVVLLNLWASWCNGCQEEMPRFVKLQKKFSKKRFSIVLSSIDSDPSNAIDFLQEVDKNRVLTALYDANKHLPKAYKCIGMPSSFLIDKHGKIIKIYVGSLSEDAIKDLETKIALLIKE